VKGQPAAGEIAVDQPAVLRGGPDNQESRLRSRGTTGGSDAQAIVLVRGRLLALRCTVLGYGR
jgi:hypothetical protein